MLLDSFTEDQDDQSLDKATKTPSKHVSWRKLEQTKKDHGVLSGGGEYHQDELDSAIVDAKVRDAEKMVQQADRMQRRTFKKSSMAKGANGDWKKEGYSISHKQTRLGTTVTAHDKHGNLAGEVDFHHHDQQNKTPNDVGFQGIHGLYPDHTGVGEEHQRKGLATAMYHHAEKITGRPIIRPGPYDQTKEAKHLWDSNPSRKFGKSAMKKTPAEFIGGDNPAFNTPAHPSDRFKKIHEEVLPNGLQHSVFMYDSPVVTNFHHTIVHPQHGLVAHLTTSAQDDLNETPQVDTTIVDKKFRGQGIGQSLYNAALGYHGRLQSDSVISREAMGRHKALANMPGVQSNFNQTPYLYRQGAEAGTMNMPVKSPADPRQPYEHKVSDKKAFQEAAWAPKKTKLAASELKKSRPRITFPRFKRVTTRPDQEVQTMENNRQKEIYGRKVTNANTVDANYKFPSYFQGFKNKIKDKQEMNDKLSSRVAGRFDRNTLGTNYSTPKGPKAAAIAGKLRSKFEPADEEHQGKLDEHKEKISQARDAYDVTYKKWKDELNALPTSSNAYWQKVSERPKFKKPRKPSKTLKDTRQLDSEQQKARGRASDSTIEHEAHHYIMDDIQAKYGKDVSSKVHRKLLDQFHPDAVYEVGRFISEKMDYKTKSPNFTEEILAHSRDILVNPKKREQFKSFLKNSLAGGLKTEDQINEHIKNLKIGHQKAYKVAQELDPADVGYQEGEGKLAASENQTKFKLPRFKLKPTNL